MQIKLTKLLIILITFIAVPAFAKDNVVDNAGLLNAEEKATLQALIDSIAVTYDFDLVIVTQTTIGEMSPRTFAATFFSFNDYGSGPNKDGCLLLQVTSSRDWFIHHSQGRARNILIDTAFDKLEHDIVECLRQGMNYDAYYAFLSDWQEFLALEAQGRSYNFFHQYNRLLVVISWVVGFLVGVIVLLIWKKKMDTARAQTHAQEYIVADSLRYRKKDDIFLKKRTSRIRRDTGSSGSGLSGSSYHSSSGRGGKY